METSLGSDRRGKTTAFFGGWHGGFRAGMGLGLLDYSAGGLGVGKTFVQVHKSYFTAPAPKLESRTFQVV